ncbi:MAG: membrane protein insertase YidC [Myxococcota bacterium]
MDRNNIIAFALSMLVFAAYLMYQGEQRASQPAVGPSAATEQVAELNGGTSAAKPVESSPAAAAPAAGGVASDGGSTTHPGAAAAQDAASSGASTSPAPVREIAISIQTLENADVRARVSNGPQMIEGWELLHYDERLPGGAVPIDLVDPKQPILSTGVVGIAGGFADLRFEVVHAGPREILQRAENEAGTFTRTLRLDPTGYGFDLELAFDSRLATAIDTRFEIGWPARTSTRADFREVSLLAYGEEEGVTRSLVGAVGQPGFLGFGGSTDGVERVEGAVQFAGFDVPYFTGVLLDAESRNRLNVEFEALEPTVSARARLTLPSVTVAAGGSAQERLRGFFGPKAPQALEAVAPALAHTVNRGWSWLEPLTRFFEIALDWLYRYIPNYGIAIIVLTILVRLVTAPLMMNQMRSAERMRAVQPRMKALQEKYKDDRQRQSEELMKLYREEGINPLGGCLPLLLQFPVLVGLFYALRSSIGLRHAHFASWIDDLSQPDLLFTMPGLDFPIRLLPLLMGASMYVQQKMTPTTGMDPTQARMMLVMMPAMMLLISYTFPSGLVLYWTVSNLLGIGHQYWIRRQSKPQPA